MNRIISDRGLASFLARCSTASSAGLLILMLMDSRFSVIRHTVHVCGATVYSIYIQ